MAAATARAGPTQRRAALRQRLATADGSALLVVHAANIRYLTGFQGGGALLMGVDGSDNLITVPLNEVQARHEVDPGVEVVVAERPLETACRCAAGRRRVLYEKDRLPVAQREAWVARDGPSLKGVTGWVEELRAVKSPAEVEAIARAAEAATGAFEAVLSAVRPGISELQLAARLESELRERGAERFPFDTIVLFGERSALPHGVPSRRELGRGDVVLLDFGAVVDGYVSDVTRTVAYGAPDPRLAEAYRIAWEAQHSALDGLRADVPAREVDALARTVVEAAGFGDHFVHSLGHGIGLEVHEQPRLWKHNPDPLPGGAVVTVEPGIYIENLGGLRIEDDVVVGSQSYRTLTGARADELVVL